MGCSGSAGAPVPPAANNTGMEYSATTIVRYGATRKRPGSLYELHKLSKDLAGTTIKADVAMIYDYDSQWALRIQPAFPENNPHKAMQRYYAPLFRAGINVDMIKTTEDFSQYCVVIASDLYVLPDSVARALSEFVKNGGVLVTDCRTGVKNETNLCHERTLPGLLSKATGIAIEEYEGLAKDMEYPVVGAGSFAGKFTAIDYADWIRSPRRKPKFLPFMINGT